MVPGFVLPCSFDLPIFGLDMVLVKGRVSLAVCDLMSLRPDRRLPPHYMEVREREDTSASNALVAVRLRGPERERMASSTGVAS